MSRRRYRGHFSGFALGGSPQELDEYARTVVRNIIVARFSRTPADALPRELVAAEAFRRELSGAWTDAVSDDIDIEFNGDIIATDTRPRSTAFARRWSQWLRNAPVPRRPPSAAAPVARNIRKIGKEFKFDRDETDLLQLGLAVTSCRDLAELLALFPVRRNEDLARILADALRMPLHRVRRRIAEDSPLMTTGLLELSVGGEQDWTLEVDRRLVELLFEPRLANAAVMAAFVPEEPPPTLDLADFAHVPEFPMIADLVRRAHETGATNVHIAFIGDVGTGKNEGARLVGKLSGARVFLAGAPDGFAGSPSPRHRLTSLSAAYRTLRGRRAIVVMDEFDDLFSGAASDEWMPFQPLQVGPLSRLSLNRLMEQAPVVTIWICNPGAWLQASQLRRFSAVVHFRPLGEGARRNVMERLAGTELPPKVLDAIARAYPVSPAELASALRASRLVGRGAIDRVALERILAGATRAIPGRRPAPALRAGHEYSVEAVNASVDLRALADRLATWKPDQGPGPALFLHGVPGSGKSEFLHFLGRRMDRKVVVKQVADIEDPFLGMTERRIADAFEEAKDENALLLFDEGDSWLRDRRCARHQWEYSITNQFLQSLEAHSGIVGVTSNLFEQIDPAVMRRMSHKIRFLPVRPDQARLLFDAHLSRLLPNQPASNLSADIAVALAQIGGLVPGDFAAVARRFALEGGAASKEGLLAALSEEVAARSVASRRVGFA